MKAHAQINWEDDRAATLSIPRQWLQNIPGDSISNTVQVRLQKSNTAILGEYTESNDTAIIFRPVIPFTRGLTYEIWIQEKLLEEITIPAVPPGEGPKLVMVYPLGHIVPANVLKIHLAFSKPMQEGDALQKILLLKDARDTVRGAFLDMQQELWNKERTILTIWFDPGRVKRDLQPNVNMGPPLEEGMRYLLVIDKQWQDTHGASLPSDYHMEFVTGLRDSTRPDINQWIIEVPRANSDTVLHVDVREPLDYVLLQTAVQVTDDAGNGVPGILQVDRNQKGFSFTPASQWKEGTYMLRVESRLEDLAGNNLNRLFDNDLSRQQQPASQDIFTRSFRVK